MSTTDNTQYEDQCQKMIQLAEKFLPLVQWDFKYSERLVRRNPVVVYNSQWCRVMFSWSGWDTYGGDTIGIYYGRLHASINHAFLSWKGEECYCWHREYEALQYLDGLSPKEAVASYGQIKVRDAFIQSELGKSLSGVRKQPEWLIRMHAAIWKYYGERFFELFDLRRPDIWEEYTKFVKEFYKIKGLNSDITPPQDQIC